MSVLLEQALKLPITERIRLADDLYDSVGGSLGSTPLTDQQLAEIDRRIEDHRKNPDDAIPWKTVKKELRQRTVAKGDKQ